MTTYLSDDVGAVAQWGEGREPRVPPRHEPLRPPPLDMPRDYFLGVGENHGVPPRHALRSNENLNIGFTK